MNWKEIPSGVAVHVAMNDPEYYPDEFVAEFVGTNDELVVLNVEGIWRGDGTILYDGFPQSVCRLATIEDVLDYYERI